MTIILEIALACSITLILYGAGVIDYIADIFEKPQRHIKIYNCAETYELIEDFEAFGLVDIK